MTIWKIIFGTYYANINSNKKQTKRKEFYYWDCIANQFSDEEINLLICKKYKKKIRNHVVDPQVDKKNSWKIGDKCFRRNFPRDLFIIIFALFHREFKSFTAKYLKKFSSDETKIIDLTYELEGENIINL